MKIMRQLRKVGRKKSRYITKADVRLSKRKDASHKGDNGKVLVVGGSIDYVGAVLLAGMAAFRTGTDLVVIAAPERVAWAINTFSPDFITRKFKGDYFKKQHAAQVVRLSRDFDVVLIGNGVGLRKETASFVKQLIKKVKAFKVIDADAIKVLKLSDTRNSIITPHKAELAALMKHNKIASMPQLRKGLGSNVLLVKGKVDAVISKSRVAYNKTGNAGMTVAGTGDVLAGIAAGLLAQNKNLFKSACAAAYISGLIGDALLKEKGFGFIASDMLEKIPAAMKRVV
jgi:NAD(P)H-hydrate epimerase